MTKNYTYEFGKNWNKFISDEFEPEKLEQSKKHLLKLLRLKNLNDKTFLDIGCGSGLHSLAAFQAGAENVVSFDFDLDSVTTTQKLWAQAGKPSNWRVIQGSVLDQAFIYSLGQFDIVYSWGVLHHTGNMWQALNNAVLPLSENGLLYISLYAHEMYQTPSTDYWLALKKRYNQASQTEREEMELDYAWTHVLKPIADKGNNPLHYIHKYNQKRGMEFWTDVRDWLGGYPMEFAKTREVIDRLKAHQLMLQNIVTGEGCTEFVFTPKLANNHYTDALAKLKQVPIEEISHIDGFGYEFDCPELEALADTDGEHFKSQVYMLENGAVVGFPHARHSSINQVGEGGFCYWKGEVFFSASDNTNPIDNQRQYSLRIDEEQ